MRSGSGPTLTGEISLSKQKQALWVRWKAELIVLSCYYAFVCFYECYVLGCMKVLLENPVLVLDQNRLILVLSTFLILTIHFLCSLGFRFHSYPSPRMGKWSHLKWWLLSTRTCLFVFVVALCVCVFDMNST